MVPWKNETPEDLANLQRLIERCHDLLLSLINYLDPCVVHPESGADYTMTFDADPSLNARERIRLHGEIADVCRANNEDPQKYGLL